MPANSYPQGFDPEWLSREWLLTSNDHLQFIRKCVGAILLWLLPRNIAAVFALKPYSVPGWRIGTTLIQLPHLPAWLHALVWAAYGVSALALLAGSKRKVFVAIPATVLLLYSFVEEFVIGPSFVVMLFTYCVALLFHREPVSCSRRLIQISVTLCYLFSALHKLHPEFSGGYTLYEALHNGWAVREFVVPWTASISLPLARALSWGIIATELFLAVGPWFKKTRLAAIALAIPVHAAMSVLLSSIEIFAPVMWLGLLAFADKPGEKASPSESMGSPRETALALAFVAVMIFMPLRFFLSGPQVFLSYAFFDRWPWGFAMYLFHEEPSAFRIRYRDLSSQWHDVRPVERMTTTQGDCELLSLVDYLRREHPDAKEVVAEVVLDVNHHSCQRKTARCVRGPDGWITSVMSNWRPGDQR